MIGMRDARGSNTAWSALFCLPAHYLAWRQILPPPLYPAAFCPRDGALEIAPQRWMVVSVGQGTHGVDPDKIGIRYQWYMAYTTCAGSRDGASWLFTSGGRVNSLDGQGTQRCPRGARDVYPAYNAHHTSQHTTTEAQQQIRPGKHTLRSRVRCMHREPEVVRSQSWREREETYCSYGEFAIQIMVLRVTALT